MKKSVAITISDERLAALEMYLEQKNIKLSDEIDKCIDGLYQKNVPQNVRNFIEMKSEKKPVSPRVARFGGRWGKFTIGVVKRLCGHLSQSLRMVGIRRFRVGL